jgi:hypothetical protein
MLRGLPRIILPVSTFTGTDSTLSGIITIDEKQVAGVNTKFVDEIVLGAELYVNDIMVGVVSKILSNTLCFLEEPTDEYTGVAVIRNFKPSDVGNPIVVSDILYRIKVKSDFTNKASTLMPYIVVEGDTPEIVSYKFYGTPLYHWVVLIVNDIVNPREEWPVSEKQLLEKIALQYPGQNRNDIYEYRETTYGYVVDYDENLEASEEIYPVTIYDYEVEKNEAKRNIKMLDPNFITDFITAYYRAYTDIT